MSWDVLFAGQCEQKVEPAQQLTKFLQSLTGSSSIGELVRVLVLKGNRIAPPLLDIRPASPKLPRFHPATLQKQLSALPQDEIAIEGFWEVLRWFPGPGASEPSLEEYRLTITALGEHFYLPQFRALGADLVIDAGVSKHYALSLRGEAAGSNIAALLSEIALISSRGLKTLRGLNEDRAAEPKTNFLCFHRVLSDFTEDIQRPSPLTLRDLQTVAQACVQVEVQAVAEGAMVFHRALIEGNLGEFYHRLHAYKKVP